jgi:hypothetical protein
MPASHFERMAQDFGGTSNSMQLFMQAQGGSPEKAAEAYMRTFKYRENSGLLMTRDLSTYTMGGCVSWSTPNDRVWDMRQLKSKLHEGGFEKRLLLLAESGLQHAGARADAWTPNTEILDLSGVSLCDVLTHALLVGRTISLVQTHFPGVTGQVQVLASWPVRAALWWTNLLPASAADRHASASLLEPVAGHKVHPVIAQDGGDK